MLRIISLNAIEVATWSANVCTYACMFYMFMIRIEENFKFNSMGIAICCQILHPESDWYLVSPYRMTPESKTH